MAHRFEGFEISDVTIENHASILPQSLTLQIENFLPPEGSFDDECLQRYLKCVKDYEEEDVNFNMTLANRLRLAFSDLQADTICNKFPMAELALRRRFRCVAEYLIRAREIDKVRDENGKLLKKRGAFGKLVVVYQPLPKLRDVLQRQGLLPHEQKGKTDCPNVGSRDGSNESQDA